MTDVGPSDAELAKRKPRAVVAVSDDRQWLVLQKRGRWFVLRDKDYALLMVPQYEVLEMVSHEDTGQSAEDVLREWLAGRAG